MSFIRPKNRRDPNCFSTKREREREKSNDLIPTIMRVIIITTKNEKQTKAQRREIEGGREGVTRTERVKEGGGEIIH